MRVLVAGWFSFPDMGTTAGDIIAKDIICDWLKEAGIDFDAAVDPRFDQPLSVEWKTVSPADYTDLIFVCGPFGNGWPVTELLEKFSHCRFSGINLSLLQSLSEWNPFTFIYARDHMNDAFPDITFACVKKKIPLVGVIKAHKQKEYGKKALHDIANSKMADLVNSREMSVVEIDTALSPNAGGLRTAAEVERLISAMDLIVTTRLHGTVLALKNEVPVIPIDPIAGGAKISLQVKALKWPVLFHAENIEPARLYNAFEYCLSDEAKAKAAYCAEVARQILSERKKRFISDFTSVVDRPLPKQFSF